jgi:hypothetical protein
VELLRSEATWRTKTNSEWNYCAIYLFLLPLQVHQTFVILFHFLVELLGALLQILESVDVKDYQR